jgi:hypothetical protein
MTHFAAYIGVPKKVFERGDKATHEYISEKMEPYHEENSAKNKDYFYDWYRVGGRWNGEMTGREREDGDGGFNFGKEFESIKDNSLPAKKILAKFQGDIKKDKMLIPSHLLGVDGKIRKSKNMGWFGMSSPTKEEKVWDETFEKFLKATGDGYVVCLDCHI